jgi:hypothetical protein
VRRFLFIPVALALLAAPLGAADTTDTPKAAATRMKLKQKVTVDYKDTMLKDVVDDIKSQVDGLLIKLDAGVSMNRKISYKAKDKPLEEVFDEILGKEGLGYVVTSKDKDAYDGRVLIKTGKERGYPEGQEPAKTPPAKDKPDAPKDKPDAKDKPDPAKDKPDPKTKPDTKDKPDAKDKPDDADQAERDAARKLKFAKDLIDEGKGDKAKERLQDIIKDFPKTKAAEEAQKLLDKINK